MRKLRGLFHLFRRRPTKSQLLRWHVVASQGAHDANMRRIEENLGRNKDLLAMLEHYDKIAKPRTPIFAFGIKPNKDLEHALIGQEENDAPVILSHSFA